MNKRNVIIVIVLLLLAAILFFLLKKKKPAVLKTVMQGTTVLHSGNITMKVWDYNAVDGDTVSVSFDNKVIFDTLYLTDSPAVHEFKQVSPGDHILLVKAINEGASPPATPHISITDGITAAEFDIDSYLDSTGSWKITVQQ